MIIEVFPGKGFLAFHILWPSRDKKNGTINAIRLTNFLCSDSAPCFSRRSSLCNFFSRSLALSSLVSFVSFAKMLIDRSNPYCWHYCVQCGRKRSRTQWTYRVEFQNKDLSQLKENEEANQNRKVAAPEVFDIYPITCWYICNPRNDVVTTLWTKKGAHLIGSKRSPDISWVRSSACQTK